MKVLRKKKKKKILANVLQIQCGVFGVWAEMIHYNLDLS